MNRKYLFSLVITIVTLQACKEEVDLDIPAGEQKLVIESEVTTETDSSFVKITRTANYYSAGANETVTNAIVTINGDTFKHTQKGIYKPVGTFKGIVGKTYNLNVVADGQTYTSSAIIEPMFSIDSIFQVLKPAEPPVFDKSGYSINYMGYDGRPKIKYTFFRLGYFDTIIQRDSMSNARVLFNNDQTPVGQQYSFELPFTRFQKGEEVILIFRSVTKEMNDYIFAYNQQTSGAPGPFKVPPANLPSNIRGGCLGYFATYDIIRKRYVVK